MAMPAIGDIFQGRYELIDLLGRGGFARVFHATDAASGRHVALKIIDPSEDAHQRGIESRFEREVKVLATLRDPHTITMYDFGRDPSGLLFMVFEYIEGCDLHDLIRRVGALSEAETIHILNQVLQSLREAHAEGLLHRDIKPANIRIYEYMGDDRRAKLLDFGIAKTVEPGEGAITRDGVVIGTLQYMSADQLYGRRLSPATDLFSLGLVAYEMLAGEPAITALKPAAVALRLADDITLPERLGISPGLSAIVHRMLTSDSSRRYASADDVLRDLAALRREAPGQRVPRPAPEQHHPKPATPLAAAPAAGRARLLTDIGVTLAGLLLGAGVVVAILMIASSDDAPAGTTVSTVDAGPEAVD